jgi:alpha-glucosidase
MLLLLGLSGQVFIYQGEELGLEEVDLPDESRQDPVFLHSGGRSKGRDGCRVPLPWRRGAPNAGFSEADPWLPMPAGWDRLAVDAQAADGESTLAHFRRALAERARLRSRLPERVEWLQAPAGFLAYRRGSLAVACNFNAHTARLDLPGRLLLGSDPLVRTNRGCLSLPANSAAWLHKVARL